MTFATLLAQVKAVVFPIGEPENLVTLHNTYVVDALNDIQENVLCYRDSNVDVIGFADTLYTCGITVTTCPDGFIKRVYTLGTDECCRVNYRKSTRAKLVQAQSEYEINYGEKTRPTQPTDKSALKLSELYPGASADSKLGRAITGYWALEGCRLYAWPHLESTEDLVIEWTGVKDSYAQADSIFDSSTAVIRAVRLYLQWQIAQDIEQNPETLAKYKSEYFDARANLIWRCRQKLEGTYAQEDELPILTNGCANPGSTVGTVLSGDTVQPDLPIL